MQLFVERAQQAHPAFALSAGYGARCGRDLPARGRAAAGHRAGGGLGPPFRPGAHRRGPSAPTSTFCPAPRGTPPRSTAVCGRCSSHSWNLLPDEEQRVFRQPGGVPGGLGRGRRRAGRRAHRIHSLVSLVDKSLLRREAAGRFEIHEVLRQYATEKLAERPEEQAARPPAPRRLLPGSGAVSRETELQGNEQVRWLARLDEEHDNLRAALHWAVDKGEAELGVQLAGALWRFWYIRGYNSEGREHLAAVLALPPTPARVPAARTRSQRPAVANRAPGEARQNVALNGAGVLASVQGEHGKARLLYEESLALSRELGDKQGIAASLNNLGVMAHQLGDSATGRAMQEESLALRRELGDMQGIAASLNNLGVIAQAQGDYQRAQVRQEEALALRRELGDTLGIASSLGNLGVIAQEQGDYAAARGLFEESLILRREVGDKTGMAELFSNLGMVARKQGDYAAAQELYEQCLTLSRESGYTWSIAVALSNLGVVAQDQGEYEQARARHKESLTLRRDLGEKISIAGSLACIGAVVAGSASSALARRPAGPPEQRAQLERAARLFGAVDTLLESTPAILSLDDRQLYVQNLALVQSLLDEAAFTRAWAAGRTMSMEQAIDYALEG